MAEPHPRNWKAMRSDRVLAMAENRFGRTFASKDAAISELQKLPAAEQRRMSKTNVSRAEKARRASAAERMIAGMSASNRPTDVIATARAQSAKYFEAARQVPNRYVAGVKHRIGREIAAVAVNAEMKIASRVAKAQTARGAKPMTTVPDRLQGLKKTQLQAVAREIGISTNSRTTAERMRREIAQRIVSDGRHGAKSVQVAGLFHDVDGGRVTAAAKAGAVKATAQINAAIDKVAAPTTAASGAAKGVKHPRSLKAAKALPPVEPLPRAARFEKALAESLATTAAVSRKPRGPKANPARASQASGLVDKVRAATSAHDAAGMRAALEAMGSAKLSKAESHALAKAAGVPVAASTSGVKARKLVETGLRNRLLDVARMTRLDKIAVAVSPLVLPALASVAAVAAMSDSAHAGEGPGQVVVKGGKAAADVITGGAVSEFEAAKARGASTAEAAATGAFKGAANIATFGLADTVNTAAKDQGGFPGVVSNVVTAAVMKVGDLVRGDAGNTPGAFLNEAAERKADAVDRAPKPIVIAAQQTSDGRTEGYMRRGANGQMVRVAGYRTPDRR